MKTSPSKRASTSSPGSVSICFSDELKVPREQISWKGQGVTLITKWSFTPGVELEFGLEYKSKLHRCSAVVVSCEPHPDLPARYLAVFYFAEQPCREMVALWLGQEGA